MPMYVWTKEPFFYAVAQAANVADARQRMIQEIGENGDGTCPIRDKARKHVLETTPSMWVGINAEFALTDSAEQIELGEDNERKSKEIKSLKSELDEAQHKLAEMAAALANLPHELYCNMRVSRFEWDQVYKGEPPTCNCIRSAFPDPSAALAEHDAQFWESIASNCESRSEWWRMTQDPALARAYAAELRVKEGK